MQKKKIRISQFFQGWQVTNTILLWTVHTLELLGLFNPQDIRGINSRGIDSCETYTYTLQNMAMHTDTSKIRTLHHGHPSSRALKTVSSAVLKGDFCELMHPPDADFLSRDQTEPSDRTTFISTPPFIDV